MKWILVLSVLFGYSLAANYTIFCGLDINGWVSENFFPSVLTIGRGDSVTFVSLSKNLGVTFSPSPLPMFLASNQNGDLIFSPSTFTSTGGATIQNMFGIYSSGQIQMGSNWTTYFPNTGIFSFFNIFGLPWMTGTVIVVDHNMNLIPDSEVDNLSKLTLTRIATQVFPDLDIAKGVLDTYPSGRRLHDGTFEWTVRMVGDLWTASSYARFVPANFTVGVGDTVIFVNDDIGIHTVSFNSSGHWATEVFNDSNGYLVFNGIFAEPHDSTADNYTGGFANSGFILPLSLRGSLNTSRYTDNLGKNFTFTAGGSSSILSTLIGNITFGGNRYSQSGSQGQTITNNNNIAQGQTITNTNNNMGGTITNNNNGMGSNGQNVQNVQFNPGHHMRSNTTETMLHYWKITFGTPGTYPYRCDIHWNQGMLGQIVVKHRNSTAVPM